MEAELRQIVRVWVVCLYTSTWFIIIVAKFRFRNWYCTIPNLFYAEVVASHINGK